MKKVLLSIVALVCAGCLWAVPAYPGWQTKTLADGTTIEVRLVGDEFYSYWETKDGQLVLEQKDGKFVKSQEPIPSPEEFRARRAKGMSKRVCKAIGTKPNLAPKGVVILVNFADSVMKQGHDSTMFDNMCNAQQGECTTNVYNGVNYGSAAQFFADQSKDSYRPQFDVFGPVTLPHKVAYYGEEGERDGQTEHNLYVGDFVVEALLAADDAGCDFSQYDADEDGVVDFVYFIYAYKGEADGGESWTIWPHNSYLEVMLYYKYTHGRDDYYWDERGRKLPVLDGKEVNNYACSAELNGHGDLGGIGTLCHEFGHVMGLPDYYDTKYGTNYRSVIEPNEWDVMSSGNYNGGGHCPPNYNPWSKYFFSWIDPINLGQESTSATLYPSGTADYNAYHIFPEANTLATPITNGLSYFLEYRNKTGWDTFTPSEGMAIWRCDFDTTSWKKNVVNNTAGDPRLILVCSSGVMIGRYNPAGCMFPNGSINAWEDGTGNQVNAITINENNVTFQFDYDDTPVEPIWTEWAYYDDGHPSIISGTNDTSLFYWGIKFQPNTLAHDTLYKVSVFEDTRFNKKPITIYVFSGGLCPIPENVVHVEQVETAGVNGWHEITLTTPVHFNPAANLWIMLSEEGDQDPAIGTAHNGARNTSWISYNGTMWREYISQGTPYSWMIRAYIGQSEEPTGVDNLSTNDQRQTTKILRDGQIFILRDGKTYNVLGTPTTND